MDGFPTEFVSCRVEATGLVEPLRLADLPFAGSNTSAALKGQREIYLPELGEYAEVNIYDGDQLEYGNVIDGVSIVETGGSTLGVWENDRLVVGKHGDFEVEIGHGSQAWRLPSRRWITGAAGAAMAVLETAPDRL